MDKIKLYKPIMVNEEEVKEIIPDFDNLQSNAFARTQIFLLQRQYPVTNPSSDVELNSLLCGLAAGMEMEDAYRLHPKDKMRLAAESINFFNTDLEDI